MDQSEFQKLKYNDSHIKKVRRNPIMQDDLMKLFTVLKEDRRKKSDEEGTETNQLEYGDRGN